MSAVASSSRQPQAAVTPSLKTAGTASPSPSATNNLDIYRPIAKNVKKHISAYLPSDAEPLLSSLLGIDSTKYSSRLSGKHVLLTSVPGAASSTSALVTGKKRNRGDETARRAAQKAQQEQEQKLADIEAVGLRMVKRRVGSVRAGQRLQYNLLLPLYYMHTHYLFTMLGCPPLPPAGQVASTAANAHHRTRLPPGLSIEGIQSKILKADFTGIRLRVISARNPSLAEIEGIAVEETSGTFVLVSPDDRVRVIPKAGTIFRLSFPAYSPPSRPYQPTSASLPDGVLDMPPTASSIHEHLGLPLEILPRIELDLMGSNFQYRSTDRAGRKFRPPQTPGSGWAEDYVHVSAEEGGWSDLLDGLEQEGGRPVAKKAKAETKIAAHGRRKRDKSRRKDPPAWGKYEIFT